MKFCIDCMWYNGVALQDGKYLCIEPRNNFTHPVDGLPRQFDANLLRLDDRYCGLDGKWWKEKQ